MTKILTAAVPDNAPQKRGFTFTDGKGGRIPTEAHRVLVEESVDGSALLRCVDDQGRELAADPFDNVGCAQGAAFEKFAVQPEDWYAPIYVDAGRRATLRHAGSSRDFLTVQEAVIAWQSLPAEQRQRSTIKVTEDDGPLFKADEIERLHYGPKPPHA